MSTVELGSVVHSQCEVDETWLRNILQAAQAKKFYGRLIIIMEEGFVRRVIKEESLLPPTQVRKNDNTKKRT